MTHYDVLVVGAGITGITVAERLGNNNLKVLLIDTRNHIGGNCHDRYDDFGILMHPYGPHIFHTNETIVSNYLSKFTTWIDYQHKVTALVNNIIIPLPFNLDSILLCFDFKKAKEYKKALLDTFEEGTNIPILSLKETTDPVLLELFDFIYKNIFLNYTIKQWGMKPTDIDEGITARVPIRVNSDDRYFLDDFQKMPINGFDRMFSNMLTSKSISLYLNQSFETLNENISYKKCVYTGMVDELLKFTFGALPYRSLNFEHKNICRDKILPTAVMNYPSSDVSWTRITEFKQITQQVTDGSSICIEHPLEYRYGKNTPYYPVVNTANNILFQSYLQIAKKKFPNYYFAGRLGKYKYLNMDQAVLEALKLSDEIINDLMREN